MKNVKFTKENIVNWCKAHKKELIVGGCASIGAIISFVIFKNKNKALMDATSDAEKNLIDYICRANEYRAKYPKILDGGTDGYKNLGMWFVDDYIINAPIDFTDVNGEPDIAVVAINEIANKVINEIDLNDISSIEMMVNLK